MTDWHSHVLPGMDDGSHSVEESLAMLGALREQGIERVIATPHFYADDETVERFLERREQAYRALLPHLTEDLPQVLLGAEVRYYPGIRHLEGLERLRIGDGELLLLEMPIEPWSDYQVRELRKLASRYGQIKLVLAHIDRYFRFLPNGVAEQLCDDHGILLQANAGAFERFGDRRRVLGLLRSGRLCFIGSDCHDMQKRPPQIRPAYRRVEKALGDEAFAHWLDRAERMQK